MSKKDKIIEAAYDILKSGNYQNMSTAKIAKVAGVAEGTLYRYFKNKDEIFLEAIRQSFGVIYINLFKGTKKEFSLDENLNVIIDNTFFMADEKKTLYKVYYKAFSELENPNVKSLLADWMTKNLDCLKDIFIWAVERGEIHLNEENISFVVRWLWGTAELIFKEEALGTRTETAKVLRNNIIKIKDIIKFLENTQ